MIGSLVFEYYLNSPKITSVVSLVRKPTGLTHEKLQEVTITNFEDYSQLLDLFENVSAAYFCLGVYAGAVSDELFKKIDFKYLFNSKNYWNCKH